MVTFSQLFLLVLLHLPGLLQGPVVPGDGQAQRARPGPAGQGVDHLPGGLLGISGPSRRLSLADTGDKNPIM